MDFNVGDVIKTTKDKTFALDRGKKVIIPKGTKGFVSRVDADSVFVEIARMSEKTMMLFEYKRDEITIKESKIDIDLFS